MKVSVIIVTYNSAQVIGNCLETLPKKFNLYVVDNGSTDNTLDIVKKANPKARIIHNKENIGFGRANNLALEKIETDYAFILNPDVLLRKNCIEEIISFMDTNPKYAICCPHDIAVDTKLEKVSEPLVLDRKEVICAFAMLRMQVFKKIGFFDENIFMYCEDNELSLRTRLNGHKIGLVVNAHASHIGNRSTPYSDKLQLKKHIMAGESFMYVHEKYNGSGLKSKLFALRKIITHFLKSLLYAVTFKKAKRYRHYGRGKGILNYSFFKVVTRL